MAIIENRTTEIGDVLYIRTEVPIIGLITLIDFLDIVTGETVNRYFKKEFRYSRDGINFYPWQLLTSDNISEIIVDPTDTFVIEYRYSRVGSDITGELSFENITLEADFELSSCGTLYSDSIFAQFFSCQDIEVLGWAINVLEKLYKKGIVPTYIERGNNFEQDRDYIDFWRTLTTFFAYIVVYARKFQNFSQIQSLLSDYLIQRGLFICEDSQEMVDLIYLKENFYREISKRGSLSMLKPKDNDQQVVDGELLRLICKDIFDEFIFCLIDNKNQGWCINNSSPLWKGNNSQKHLNKSWEDDEDFTDLDLIPTFGTVTIVTDGDKDVIQIDGSVADTRNGIGIDYSSVILTGDDKLIQVSPYLNYKISFQIRQPNDLNENITFGILGFDKDGNQITCKEIFTGSLTDFFFQQKKLNKNDTYYLVEGILYNFEQNILPLIDAIPKIGFGTHLKFGNKNVCQIMPFIISDTPLSYSGDGTFYVWNLKMVPYDHEYSTYVLNGANLIKMWYKNNNVSLTEQKIEDNINYYLKPYSTILKTTEILQPRIIPSIKLFDFVLFNVIWNSNAGTDFNLKAEIFDTNSILDGEKVGKNENLTIGTGPTPDFYLEYGGDNNLSVGIEAILINFNKLTEDLPDEDEFKIKFTGWFNTKITGDVRIEIITYLGGTMIASGTTFVNVGGIEKSKTIITRLVETVSIIDIPGEELIEVTFHRNTNSLSLIKL